MSTHRLAPPPKEELGQETGNANPLGFLGDIIKGKGKGKQKKCCSRDANGNKVCTNHKGNVGNGHGHSHGPVMPQQPQSVSPQQFELMVKNKVNALTPTQRVIFEQAQSNMVALALKQLLRNASAVGGPLGGDMEMKLLHAVRMEPVTVLHVLLCKFGRGAGTMVRWRGEAEAHPLLHWAALEDRVDVIEYLLHPEAYAQTHKPIPGIEDVDDGEEEDSEEEDGHASINQIKLYTVKPASPDARNPRGETALHWASIRGHLRTIHALVKAGADLYATDAKGYSALHHAAQYGQTTAIALLHRRGIQVDIRDNNGRTPLHWAAYKGENMTVQWLVDHGADQAAEDWEKCLPIHWAAIKGMKSTVRCLTKSGSFLYLDRADTTGATPRMLAQQKAEKATKGGTSYNAYKAIEKHLKVCENTKSDGRGNVLLRALGKGSFKMPHFSYFLWPITAPIAWYMYMTRVMPVTSHHTIVTILIWTSFIGKWISWILMQARDPGALVTSRSAAAKAKRRSAGGSTYTAVNGDVEMQVRAAGNDERVSAPNCTVVPEASAMRSLYDKVLDEGLLVPVCTTCEIVKPLRSKHDRVTDRCICKFDHYCPWMNTAIGLGNYREFFFSMFFAMVCMFSWLVLALLYTIEVDRSKSFFRNFWNNIGFELYAWMYTVVALYALLMVSQHTIFIMRNMTTNEVINTRRYRYLHSAPGGGNMYDRGRLSNIAEFFGLLRPVDVDLKDYYKVEFSGGSAKEELRKNERMMFALQQVARRDYEEKVKADKLKQAAEESKTAFVP